MLHYNVILEIYEDNKMSFLKALLLIPYTIISWAYFVWCVIVHNMVYRPFMWASKDPQWWIMRSSKPFLKWGAFLLGIKLWPKGIANIPKEGTFIVASNHQSLLDIATHMLFIPRKFHFFAKKELNKIPFLRGNIRYMGHFIVDRENPKEALKQMVKVRNRIEEGGNMLIFPEGTRSTTDDVLPFKRGLFILALQTGVQIVPSYIRGANKIVTKSSFLTQPGAIDVVYGKPIKVKKIENPLEQKKESIELMNKVRNAILELKESLR